MQLARPAYAPDPRQFGRRGVCAVREEHFDGSMSNDFKLFAMTFVAGFLFVSILIG